MITGKIRDFDQTFNWPTPQMVQPKNPSNLGSRVPPEQLAVYRQELELLNQLLTSPYWPYLEQLFKHQADAAFSQLTAATDPHAMAKGAGGYQIASAIKAYLPQRREHILNFLKMFDPQRGP